MTSKCIIEIRAVNYVKHGKSKNHNHEMFNMIQSYISIKKIMSVACLRCVLDGTQYN